MNSMTTFLERSDSEDSGQYYIRAYHGRYVAAHPDGQLATDDEDIKHHDIQWMILNRDHGKVALQIVKHRTFLSAERGGKVRCSDQQIDHDSLWERRGLDNGKYGFRSTHGRWLSATGITDETPSEEEPHLMVNKEHLNENAEFEIIPVEG